MLSSNNLNPTIFSTREFNFEHQFEMGEWMVEYSAGCKNSWLGIYFYLIRVAVPELPTLSLFLNDFEFGISYFSAVPDGALASVLKQYPTFLPGQFTERAPVLSSWINGKRNHKDEVYIEKGEIRLRTPGFSINPKKPEFPAKVKQRLKRFVTELIAAIKEANLLMNSESDTPAEAQPVKKELKDIPFFNPQNLDLPNHAVADKLEVTYLRFHHSFYLKDYYLCQTKVGNLYVSFWVQPYSYFDDRSKLKANLPHRLSIIEDVYRNKDKDFMKETYPNLFNLLNIIDSKGTKAGFGTAEYKPKDRTTFPTENGKLPDVILLHIPVFLSNIIQADLEAMQLCTTEKFAKDFQVWKKREETLDKTAGISLALLTAKIVFRVGDFNLGSIGDGVDVDSNIDADVDVDADAAVEVHTITPEIPEYKPAPREYYMFSNPYRSALDSFSANELHSLGLIDDKACDILNNLEMKHEAAKADIDAMVADICRPDESHLDSAQASYDLADAQQKEALHLREEAFANGDSAEFERQTQRARDLQYTKETVKTTANYVSDIDVRAGLKKS